MDKYVINGGKSLHGEVEISGAKNAAVAIIPAVLLADGPCRIENIPAISDTHCIINILYEMGASVKLINKSTIEIDATTCRQSEIPHDETRRMRGSSYLLGALLGRYGNARVSLPGGCDFGVRPIDQHLKGFAALGAKAELDKGMVILTSDGLVGAPVYMDVVSVGATVNVMLAAVRAEGLTVIENAAKEPHVVDLANFLNSMGADIMGAGTDVIKIKGVKSLSGTTYSIIPDQIEAGTFMSFVAGTGGDVLVKNVIPKHLESITAKLLEMGVDIEENDDSIRVRSNGQLKSCNIKTMPHPGFPTDMQPQFGVLLSVAQGTGIINEGIYEHRYKYVDELSRMGASVQVDGRVAVFNSCDGLTGAPVKATDLRAGAAMILAGLIASGTTEIEEIQYIERGYENIIDKLTSLGADIRKVPIRDVDSIKQAL